jgi:uncharacterized membrane protein (UPF0182 family)
LQETYRALQELRSFYQYADVDIDRYPIDGASRSVVLSVRGLNPHDLPGKQAWVNRHLQYTHGYGAVLSSANAVDSQGRPDFLLANIPPVGKPDLSPDGARIYFSENLPDFAVVRTKQPEIDYQAAGTPTTTTYTGEAGVRLSSPLRRFAFALRYGDPNILLSAQLTSDSRVVFNRDIRDRVHAAAPFLSYDSDPYPVIVDKRVFWVQDAYTTSDRYPYAEQADTAGLRAGASLAGSKSNYIRNSVKVVIDAFNGATTFYLVDQTDPIAKSYAKAFPDLFTPGQSMPAELRAHLRYPEDLFRVQSNMFASYHVTNPDVFFASNDDWDIAQDPGTGRVSQTLRTTNDTTGTGTGAGAGASGSGANGVLNASASTAGRLQRMEPTYLLLKLPGEQSASFLILQPFVPASRDDRQKNLTAFLIAHSDPDKYGKLIAFEMPRNEQVDGPLIVNNAIQSEPDISRELTQLNQQGSSALLGQVQVIPIENSLLYVRPLYVTSQQTPIPEVKRVIVVHNGRAVMRPTLREALTVLFGDAPATLEQGAPGTGTTPTTVTPGTTPLPTTGNAAIDDVLARAEAAFVAADAALKQGDLAQYQAKIKEARDLIAEATRRLAAARSASSTTTTTRPSA